MIRIFNLYSRLVSWCAVLTFGTLCYGTTLSVTPPSGPPTTRVTLDGSGFSPGETVDLSVGSNVFGKAIADGLGDFTVSAKVPRAFQPGPYTVKATGEASGSSAQQTFTVATNWPTFRGTSLGLGLNPFENTINADNAKFLGLAWQGLMGDLVDFSSPAVVDGVVYVGSFDGSLYAFDANGCGQDFCDPLWSGQTGNDITSSPAVANGVAYIGSADRHLYAFDANGCGQSTCTPLWRGPVGSGIVESSPVVAGGFVFVGAADGKLYAFDAKGCGHSTCNAVWIATTAGQIFSSPAVAAGVVYIGATDGKLYAFDAHGCGQSTCQPLWAAQAGSSISGSSAAIANGVVYVGSFEQNLYAFDAHGCGKSTCSPLWVGTTGPFVESSPAVANGVVYVGDGDDLLNAFDAHGCGHSVCDPLWRGEAVGAQAALVASPTVANGVVYVGENNGMMEVFDAKGCGQNICLPITQLMTNNEPIVSSSAAVVNGTVYFGSADQNQPPFGRLYVFKRTR